MVVPVACGYFHTCFASATSYQDGARAPEPLVDPVPGFGAGFGGRQKNAAKYVYRGGFKIPRDIAPMPSVESLEVASFTSPEAGGRAAGHSGHNPPAFDMGPPTRDFDGQTGYKDRGKRDDAGVILGLEGIISSSKMKVSSGSDRGGAAYGGESAVAKGTRGRGGNKTEGGGRMRPRTAGATVGRRHPSSLGTRGSTNIPGI